jgi:hypothetical protein
MWPGVAASSTQLLLAAPEYELFRKTGCVEPFLFMTFPPNPQKIFVF